GNLVLPHTGHPTRGLATGSRVQFGGAGHALIQRTDVETSWRNPAVAIRRDFLLSGHMSCRQSNAGLLNRYRQCGFSADGVDKHCSDPSVRCQNGTSLRRVRLGLSAFGSGACRYVTPPGTGPANPRGDRLKQRKEWKGGLFHAARHGVVEPSTTSGGMKKTPDPTAKFKCHSTPDPLEHSHA